MEAFEIRNTKLEIRNKFQNSKAENSKRQSLHHVKAYGVAVWSLEFSDLGFFSGFEFRISNL